MGVEIPPYTGTIGVMATTKRGALPQVRKTREKRKERRGETRERGETRRNEERRGETRRGEKRRE